MLQHRRTLIWTFLGQNVHITSIHVVYSTILVEKMSLQAMIRKKYRTFHQEINRKFHHFMYFRISSFLFSLKQNPPLAFTIPFLRNPTHQRYKWRGKKKMQDAAVSVRQNPPSLWELESLPCVSRSKNVTRRHVWGKLPYFSGTYQGTFRSFVWPDALGGRVFVTP